jgi:hypothetical protein
LSHSLATLAALHSVSFAVDLGRSAASRVLAKLNAATWASVSEAELNQRGERASLALVTGCIVFFHKTNGETLGTRNHFSFFRSEAISCGKGANI